MIQKGFYALASLCAMLAITQVSKMSQSIEDLNKNMAILITQMANSQVEIHDHESRLRALEHHK